MKTRKSLAMALTIVLSLAAGALLVWQISPRMDGEDLASFKPAEPPVPSAEELGKTATPINAAAEGVVAGKTPSIPRSIHNVCKNGFSIERDSSGEFQGYSCNASAYENYSTEALESLSYGDAEAASVLAYRLRHSNYPRALKLAVRAAALSRGNVSTLISATYWRPLQYENGEPSLSGFAQSYVLHSLIEKIRDSNYRMPATYEANIRRISDRPDEMLDELDDIIDRLLDDTRQIESDVTGNSTIGGDDDV
jgi:hypothetical protein